VLLPLSALFVLAPLSGQTLKVYSEFRRVDAGGEIIAADQGGRPREILSPAMARNAFGSLRLVVTSPPGQPFTLYIGQNPENVLTPTVYRELIAGGVADRLEPVKLPYTYQPRSRREPSVQSFWLDLWTPETAPVKRIRVEAQLYANERWIIYPMEVRVIATTIPGGKPPSSALPPASRPADESAAAPLREFLCGEKPRGAPEGPLTIRKLIRRNALQDLLLARSLELTHGRDKVLAGVLNALGAADPQAWCAAPPARDAFGPEWYLKVRDFLYRGPF